MGLLSGFTNTLKKTEASLLIQNLLEHQSKLGYCDLDPGLLSQKLIEKIWEWKPDIFNGKFGQRPHKLSVAAVALAYGVDAFKEDNPSRAGLMLSLGNLLSEIQVNGPLYPFNNLDDYLLGVAVETFGRVASNTPSVMEPTGTGS